MVKEQLLKELFERYFVPLSRFTEGEVGDRDKALDIVTEAFVHLYYDPDAENKSVAQLFESLVRKTLKGCSAFLKAKEDKKQWFLDRKYVTYDLGRSTEQIKIEKALHDLLSSSSGGYLSAQERKVVDLFAAGVPTREAAKLMNIDQSTYRTYKQRAVIKLKKALQKLRSLLLIIITLIILSTFYSNHYPLF